MSDIHCVLQGEERIDVYCIEDVETTHSYSLDKDVTLYSSDNSPITSIRVKKGWFVYFKPGEIHSPWNPVGGPPAKHAKFLRTSDQDSTRFQHLDRGNTSPTGNLLQKVVVKLNESIG